MRSAQFPLFALQAEALGVNGVSLARGPDAAGFRVAPLLPDAGLVDGRLALAHLVDFGPFEPGVSGRAVFAVPVSREAARISMRWELHGQNGVFVPAFPEGGAARLALGWELRGGVLSLRISSDRALSALVFLKGALAPVSCRFVSGGRAELRQGALRLDCRWDPGAADAMRGADAAELEAAARGIVPRRNEGDIAALLVRLGRGRTFAVSAAVRPAGAAAALERAVALALRESRPVALVVRKGTFARGAKAPARLDLSDLAREDALRVLLRLLPPDARVVGSTGMISREIFELREHAGEPHDRDFLTVGSMGHASQIALGVHLARPDLPVVAVEGDGAALMHLGALAIVGRRADGHFLHVVLNNAAHDSVGGQPTVADAVDLPAVARACGYRVLPVAATLEGIAAALADRPFEGPRPAFLEIRVRKGARKDLGRPTVAPVASKTAFMAALRAER